jgi:hypothetical protein
VCLSLQDEVIASGVPMASKRFRIESQAISSITYIQIAALFLRAGYVNLSRMGFDNAKIALTCQTRAEVSSIWRRSVEGGTTKTGSKEPENRECDVTGTRQKREREKAGSLGTPLPHASSRGGTPLGARDSRQPRRRKKNRNCSSELGRTDRSPCDELFSIRIGYIGRSTRCERGFR